MNSDVQGATLSSSPMPQSSAGGDHGASHGHPYHLVDPSPWPLIAAMGAGLMLFVVSLAVNILARYIISATGPGAKGRRKGKRS